MSLYIRAVDFTNAMEINKRNRCIILWSKYFGMLKSHNKNIIHTVYCYTLGEGWYKVLNSRKLNSKLEGTHTNTLKCIHKEGIRKEKEDMVVKPTNAHKCAKVYYKHHLPSQGCVLQRMDTSRYYKSLWTSMDPSTSLCSYYTHPQSRRMISLKNFFIQLLQHNTIINEQSQKDTNPLSDFIYVQLTHVCVIPIHLSPIYCLISVQSDFLNH